MKLESLTDKVDDFLLFLFLASLLFLIFFPSSFHFLFFIELPFPLSTSTAPLEIHLLGRISP